MKYITFLLCAFVLFAPGSSDRDLSARGSADVYHDATSVLSDDIASLWSGTVFDQDDWSDTERSYSVSGSVAGSDTFNNVPEAGRSIDVNAPDQRVQNLDNIFTASMEIIKNHCIECTKNIIANESYESVILPLRKATSECISLACEVYQIHNTTKNQTHSNARKIMIQAWETAIILMRLEACALERIRDYINKHSSKQDGEVIAALDTTINELNDKVKSMTSMWKNGGWSKRGIVILLMIERNCAQDTEAVLSYIQTAGNDEIDLNAKLYECALAIKKAAQDRRYIHGDDITEDEFRAIHTDPCRYKIAYLAKKYQAGEMHQDKSVFCDLTPAISALSEIHAKFKPSDALGVTFIKESNAQCMAKHQEALRQIAQNEAERERHTAKDNLEFAKLFTIHEVHLDVAGLFEAREA